MRLAHNSKLKNQNSKLPQLAEKILLSLPRHLRSHSLLRAVVRLDHRHRRSEQSLLHPFLNRLRRPLEDIAVLPHPAKQSCATCRIAVAREQLRQLAHQDAAVTRSHRIGKLHLRTLRLYQLLLLLQRSIENPHRLGQNRLLVVLIIKRNVATSLADLRKHLRGDPFAESPCRRLATVEDNIIQTVLVHEVSHLCSSKRVADGVG